MARPRFRFGECGDGVVDAFVPPESWLHEVKSERLDVSVYLGDLRRHWREPGDAVSSYTFGNLRAELMNGHHRSHVFVTVMDRDTLCCVCAVGRRCHRQVAAEFLHAAGWRVVLDGQEFFPPL